MFDVVGGHDLHFVIESRSQVIQVLRIGDEDIDILAETMKMAAHKHSTAAKAPILERMTRLRH